MSSVTASETQRAAPWQRRASHCTHLYKRRQMQGRAEVVAAQDSGSVHFGAAAVPFAVLSEMIRGTTNSGVQLQSSLLTGNKQRGRRLHV